MKANDALGPSYTVSALYETPKSKALCTITLSQRFGADPSVVIHSPGSIIKDSLYKTDCLSTTHTIQVCDVLDAGYVDYINAIALCLMRSGVPIDVVVAERDGGDYMLYSPANDHVCASHIGAVAPLDKLDILKGKCLAKFGELEAQGNPRPLPSSSDRHR